MNKNPSLHHNNKITQHAIFFIVLFLFIILFSNKLEAHPSDPIQIQSDTADFNHEKNMATYHGNVSMSQGKRLLTADRLILKRNQAGKIHTVIAKGNLATFQLDTNNDKNILYGKARKIEFYPLDNIVYLYQQAQLKFNNNTLSGEKLVYNLKSKRLQSEKTNHGRTIVNIIPNAKVK